MITDKPDLARVLDEELIGFLTAVNPAGQPQTSPVWFIRDGDTIVVFNRPTAQRLESISSNPMVAFNLRGDRRARGAVTLEGRASIEEDLPPAQEFPGYESKYAGEIDRHGWTPTSFSSDYNVGLRIDVTRVRTWGLDKLID